MRGGPAVASVRADPDETAEQVTQLLPGEPVDVDRSVGAWSSIRTAYDYPGWVRSAELAEGDGEIECDRAGEQPVDVAAAYLGAPYLWGGMTAAGIDCSGLVHMAFRRTGLLVPRDAHQQAAAAARIEVAEPGDLVFYGDPVDHVAFWLGAGRILHSTGRDGLGVLEEDEPRELRDRPRRAGRLSG